MTKIKTVTDSREEKAMLGMNESHAAYVAYQREQEYGKAKDDYLKNNPEVGLLIRNGKDVFYRIVNGEVLEFIPAI
jgi:hypothetical protein